MSRKKTKLIIIGAREDGHPAVVMDILQVVGKYSLEFFADENIMEPTTRYGHKALPMKEVNWETVKGYNFTIATGCGKTRNRLSKMLVDHGLVPVNIIHPSAIVSPSARVGDGVFVGPGAIINAGAVLEDNVLVNSGAIVEHNAIVRSGATLGPGVILAGRAVIGIESIIGVGACVAQDVVLGNYCKVAGNTLVKDNLTDGLTRRKRK